MDVETYWTDRTKFARLIPGFVNLTLIMPFNCGRTTGSLFVQERLFFGNYSFDHLEVENVA